MDDGADIIPNGIWGTLETGYGSTGASTPASTIE